MFRSHSYTQFAVCLITVYYKWINLTWTWVGWTKKVPFYKRFSLSICYDVNCVKLEREESVPVSLEYLYDYGKERKYFQVVLWHSSFAVFHVTFPSPVVYVSHLVLIKLRNAQEVFCPALHYTLVMLLPPQC